jgi:hypothetical protein
MIEPRGSSSDYDTGRGRKGYTKSGMGRARHDNRPTGRGFPYLDIAITLFNLQIEFVKAVVVFETDAAVPIH